MSEPSAGALRAARKLRMKIHSMPPGTGPGQAENPLNVKWLDHVTHGDAKIIDEEAGTVGLIEALDYSQSAIRLLLDGETYISPAYIDGVLEKAHTALAKARGE